MKIKTLPAAFESVRALPRPPHFAPKKPSLFFRTLVRLAAAPDLRSAHFTYEDARPAQIKKEPCLILMNHSSFIDLELISKIFYPRPYGIVCTGDGFVGKPGLMRRLGCIPTKKFVTDPALIGDIRYALETLRMSVLMYPEASYSFDGTATPLPRKLGVLLKRLNVPVVLVKTEGAFSRDPLYNGLQKRRVDVRARVSCLFDRAALQSSSVAELDAALDAAFTFDHFAWQQQNRVRISAPFRADGLHRILYKCPHCLREGQTEGKGTTLTCRACGAVYTLDEYGALSAQNREAKFTHIPAWYRWEREEVKKELESGAYLLDTPVEIGVMADYKAIYMVGEGRLRHNASGFHLTGSGIDYTQSPTACYGLYADYYWYEIGDMICIGNRDLLYYCFPKQKDVAAKTRLAAEELYKMKRQIAGRSF